MDRYVLAVDIGTSSLKAALITPEGMLKANARVRFPAGTRTAKHWLHAFVEAWAHILRETGKIPIAAISVSGNGPTLVSINASGEPTGICMWNEPLAPQAAPAETVTPVSSPSIFLPRLASFKTLHRAEFESAERIISGPEFLVYALTGNALTILPDPRYKAAYWTEQDLASADIDPALLPPFAAQGTIAGTTGAPDARNPAWAGIPLADLIPAGIPVVAGGPDFTVALAGTGTIRAGTACDRAGTSEGLNACTAARITAAGLRTLPAVIPGLWNLSALLPDTGQMFHSWRKESGQAGKSYPELMAAIEASPFSESFSAPNLHSGRALVEKIGFSVRQAMNNLEQAADFRPLYILTGGQARNPVWNRMKADITGRTLAVTTTPDGELMGDAILAYTSLGDFSSIEQATAHMVRVNTVYEPHAERARRYTEKFEHYENLRNS